MSNSWDQYMASAEEAFHGGQPAKAQKFWILAVKEAEDADDLKRAGMTLDRMAEGLRQQGNFKDAEGVLKMGLEVKEICYGPQHSEVIGSLNNLADALHAQGKYDEAIQVVERLIEAYKVTFGAEHPGVASISINMANVYHQMKHPAAEQFYNIAIGIKTKTLGYRHEEVAALTAKYADFLTEMGRGDEALNLKQAAEESVSGVWKTVAAKMNERMGSDKLSEPKLSQKRFDRRRDQRS